MKIIEKIKHFLKEVYVELKKVSWLSSKEALRYTIIIVIVIIIVSTFLGSLDYFLSGLLKRFIIK